MALPPIRQRAAVAAGWLCAVLVLCAGGAALRGAETPPEESPAADLAAARALFEKNLDAIRHHDRDAYLACYLHSESLIRTGSEGPRFGFEELASSVGQGWPLVFEASDLRLSPVRPGLVYGTYRYRVRYAPGEPDSSGLSERIFVATDGGWRIAMTSAFAAEPGVPPPPRALVGATLVDGTGTAPVADAVVVVRDGKIDCAGSRAACPLPEGVGVVDLKGLWLTPGLVDAHVHFSQTGWADGRPDFLDVRDRHPYSQVEADLAAHPERFFRSDLCSGVTAVFDVGGYPWTWSLRSRAEASTEAPHVAAAGPLLSTIDFWLNLPAERQFLFLDQPDDAPGEVAYLAAHRTDAVKVWYIVRAPEDVARLAPAVAAAGREAKAHHLPLIVHATGLAEAKAALAAGASVLVHSVFDRPVDDDFLRLAREAGAVYVPTLTVIRGYARLAEAVLAGEEPLVDDPNGCLDPTTRARLAETSELGAMGLTPEKVAARKAGVETQEKTAAANLLTVARAGIPIAMGTDAGNPLTLHGPAVYPEMEAMQAAGLSPREVLVAATRGGARAMGREGDFGTVEAGKAADLLVVGADPTRDISALRQVRYVVRGGVVRSIEELHALASAPAASTP